MRKLTVGFEIIVLILAVILVSQRVYAQSDPAVSLPESEYWQGYLEDTKDMLTAPLSWERAQWLRVSAFVGATLVLFHYDRDIQEFFQENRDRTADKIADFVEPCGHPVWIGSALSLFYIYGQTVKDPQAREAALLSLESVVISSGFAYGLKFLSHRSRPSSRNFADEWQGPSLTYADSKMSFPSAHSAVAFSVATVFSSIYDDKPWVPYLAYSIAALTALSRINENQHWCSDVFLGSILGYYTAKSILKSKEAQTKNSLSISPMVNPDGMGLLLEYQF